LFRKPSTANAAFESVYDANVDSIYRYTFRCVGNVTDAEDLTAQTFYKALKNFWRFRWTGIPISAWLFRIATNEINTYFRHLKKNRDGELSNFDTCISKNAHLETLAQREAVMNSLACSLVVLKAEDRTLLVLRYLERRTYSEMVMITGKKLSALKMRVHRALQQLETEMEKQGVDHAFYRAAFAEP